MRDLLKKRILFFGGKGGVGKTTCASAVALAAAKAGKRVLVVSTDPAHSTSDIFERPFSCEESEVYPGINGIEVDADFEARRYIDTVKSQIARLFSPSILKEAERQIELVSTMPGVEEVALGAHAIEQRHFLDSGQRRGQPNPPRQLVPSQCR